MNENRCVACGVIIPEGLQVCPNCESAAEKPAKAIIQDLENFVDETATITVIDGYGFISIITAAELDKFIAELKKKYIGE